MKAFFTLDQSTVPLVLLVSTMFSFWKPAFFTPRHSFKRLRSFHLSPGRVSGLITSHVPPGGTNTARASRMAQKLTTFSKSTNAKRSVVLSVIHPTNFTIPLRGSTIVKLAILTSLFFILSISMAFMGAGGDEPLFRRTLDAVARDVPGVVLVGESVDVDIDEPAITIRWSIVACGIDYMLPGSAGIHGSSLCGLPASAMYIYVDNDDTPAATYNPLEIPFNRGTGARRNIQNLVEFDSDHVLDVHEARLYPFDTYKLSSTIRAVSFNNETIPIRKLATINITSSFDILTIDIESFSSPSSSFPGLTNGTQQVSRDIDMYITRPSGARFFAVLLYVVSWLLAHVTVGHVIFARRLSETRDIIPHLISSAAILVAIPQLRNSMPDAPGLDGVLIDCIGYFPQMILVALSTITLLLLVAVRELDGTSNANTKRVLPLSLSLSPPPPPPPLPTIKFNARHHRDPHPQTGANSNTSNILAQFPSPPPSPTPYRPTHHTPTPTDISRWERHRMVKHLRGEYVFPPVEPIPNHLIHYQPSPSGYTLNTAPSTPTHRRVKTMSRIMEEGEVSHWSGSGED